MTTTLTKPQPNGGTTPAKTPSAGDVYSDVFAAMPGFRRMMDAFFDSMLFPRTLFETYLQPRANIYEKDGAYVIEFAVPGYKKEDITVEAKGNEVTISGKYSAEKDDDQKQYRRREMQQGTFSRTIAFPEEIDHNRVTATLENGILKVQVYPVTATPTKQIPVTAK